MSGAPEQDAVKATKEDSIVTEAARVIGRHQGRPIEDEASLQTIKCTIQFGGLIAVNALDMISPDLQRRTTIGRL